MVIVSWSYQITLPVEIRKKLGIVAGDELVFDEENGKVFIMKLEDWREEVQGSFEGLNEIEKEYMKKYS
jgi:AbrB family looped-hinge helix DNA binding protein